MVRKGRKTQETPKWQLPLVIALGVAVVAGIAVLVAVADDPAEPGQYNPVSGFSHVHGLGVDPDDSRVLYVATHNGLIRGVDGRDWALVGDNTDDFMGFSIHPEDGNVMWSSGHPADRSRGPNLGVQKSTDGGFTWETIALEHVDFHAMTVSPADPDVIWGYHRGDLLRSTDGGSTWDAVARDVPAVRTLAGSSGDADVLYAAVEDGVHVSRDGGASWQPFRDGAATAIAVDPTDADVIYLSTGATVEKSTDGGATWDRLAAEPDRSGFGYLAIDWNDPDVVYAATFASGIHKTTDGGATWTVVRAP